MILCLDVGNSQIYGGLYENSNLKFQFRKRSSLGESADEMGLFLTSVLKENGYDINKIKQVGFCSVVPEIVYSLKNCCTRYFNVDPFVLGPGVKTGLKIMYRNPLEVGADRIATAMAGVSKYPGKNLIIIDFGTATTFCTINSKKEYLGGVILPGLKISMQALEQKTAKLPTVEIVKPKAKCGRSTVESIQSGLYLGHLGAVKEVISSLKQECFDKDEELTIIGTGGMSRLYSDLEMFDKIIPELVLEGIFQAIRVNS